MGKRPKEWTREACRDRYVRGEKISFRGLFRLTGRTQGTLLNWAKEDPEGHWNEQRERYQSAARAEIDRKTLEKTSEKVSDVLSDLAAEHYRLHKAARQVAALYFNTKSRLLAMAQAEGMESLVEQLSKLNGKDLNNFSLVLDRHLKGERIATGLEYEDLNKAIAAVTRAGYNVQETESDDTATEDQAED